MLRCAKQRKGTSVVQKNGDNPNFSLSGTLKSQPYNNIRLTFKHLNDDGVSLLNDLLMFDRLLALTLRYDPRRRISAERLLEHSYFDQHPLPCEPSLMPSFPQHRNR